MSRFKNYGLWISIAAFIPMVLEAFGLNILPDNYDQIVKALLGILILAGIINNPTTENRGFLDDKSVEDEVIEENKETDDQVLEEDSKEKVDREDKEG